MDVGERVTSKRPEEPEHELSVTVDAIHRAADSIDHHFQVIEGLAADRRDSTIAHRDIAETPMRTDPSPRTSRCTGGVLSQPMATKPLPGYVRPGRPSRRPRQFMLHRVSRVGMIALALVGALAITLLVLGLAGVHAVTDHVRIH